MEEYKLVNGVSVALTEAEKQVRRAEEEQDAIRIQRNAEIKYKDLRAAEYPLLVDQVEAIIKQLNYDRLNGKALIEPMDTIIQQWLTVQAKYPKPKETVDEIPKR